VGSVRHGSAINNVRLIATLVQRTATKPRPLHQNSIDLSHTREHQSYMKPDPVTTMSSNCRSRYQDAVKRISDYDTRYDRASAAFANEPDGEKRFQLFKGLPKSVQLAFWRNGDVDLHPDPSEHDKRVDDLDKRVAADAKLSAMLNDKYSVQSSEDSGAEESDMSYKTLRARHRDARSKEREERRTKRSRVDNDVVYAAVVERLTQDSPGIYPAGDDVDGWKDWLDMVLKE